MQKRICNRFCRWSACDVNVFGSCHFKIDDWCEEDESKSASVVMISIYFSLVGFTTLLSLNSYCRYMLITSTGKTMLALMFHVSIQMDPSYYLLLYLSRTPTHANWAVSRVTRKCRIKIFLARQRHTNVLLLKLN